MRHGTSLWNEQGKTQGHSNNRLSPSGKQIVEQAAIKCKNFRLDIIFCSPLLRAVQSANIVNKHLKVKKVKDARLIEIDQGVFTGKVYSKLSPLQIQQKETRSKKFGMESLQHAYNRVNNFVQMLKQSNYNNVLVVTHHFVAVCIEHILLTGGNFSSFVYQGNINHGQIKKYVI